MKQASGLLPVAVVIMAMIIGGCGSGTNSQLDNNIATLNAAATNVANGIDVTLPDPGAILTAGASGTTTVTTYDLLNDPNGSLSQAWGKVNGMPSGSPFQIAATERQAGQFVVETMQINGWGDIVKGGSAAIGVGQIRVDLAIQITGSDGKTEFGAGTVTFQPTLDELARVRLNPLGGEFGSLDIPNNFTGAIGDAIYTLVSGSSNNTSAKVDLTQLELQNGILRVSGKVR